MYPLPRGGKSSWAVFITVSVPSQRSSSGRSHHHPPLRQSDHVAARRRNVPSRTAKISLCLSRLQVSESLLQLTFVAMLRMAQAQEDALPGGETSLLKLCPTRTAMLICPCGAHGT